MQNSATGYGLFDPLMESYWAIHHRLIKRLPLGTGSFTRIPMQCNKTIVKAMKLTVLLLTIVFSGVYASGVSQKITFQGKSVPLQEVFTAIEHQTGFVVFGNNKLLKAAGLVTISVKDTPLDVFLDSVMVHQPFTYNLEDKTIVLSRKQKEVAVRIPRKQSVTTMAFIPPPPISGTVLGADGKPLAGASVKIKGTQFGTNTDENGKFSINVTGAQILVVSYVGYNAQDVVATDNLTIVLTPAENSLDETVIIGYGTARRRTNTGSVSSIQSAAIESQPVSNPLAALQGRIPGMVINATNGLPGSGFEVRIRGINSISGANEPLFIIDGVPFIVEPLNEFSSANGNQSPLASINPSDIERIDILKDADGTAIYGSRGANGVVLITTKRGKSGKANYNFNVYTGASKVVNMVDVLSTPEYVAMRKEAYANDNLTYDENSAPDLVLWDQQKTTNWQDYMFGNSGKMTQAYGSFSGGSEQTRYLMSGTFLKEQSVFRNSKPFTRGNIHLNLNHSSLDNKFNINSSISYSGIKDRSIASDLTSFYNLPPNYPIYDDAGDYYWFSFTQNPEAYFLRRSNTITNSVIINSVLRYDIIADLSAKVNLGYTYTTMDQKQMYPVKTFNPVNNSDNMTYFGDARTSTYIIEPQLDYTRNVGKGKLSLMAGSSFQYSLREGKSIIGESFSSEALLEDLKSAASLSIRSTTYRLYKFASAFGRANFIWDEKYVLNATFRRDGSTRFGPGKRFGNFGALGAAWIFSSEDFISASSVLSFGKLRASYGIAGSDQIDDYAYLDSWGPASFSYDGITGLSPSRLPNADYRWEESKKLEFAVELGFLNNRILFNTNYYRNISDNQLVELALTPQVGFPSMTANFPAKVRNEGWEFEVNADNIIQQDFKWRTSFNISFAKNILDAFPDIEESSYADIYEVGQSLSMVRGYQFTGIDPETGSATFQDLDGDDFISEFDDYITLGKTLPTFYGGLQNTLNYKGFELDFHFQFMKQEGELLNYGYLSNPIGTRENENIAALNRWREKGDITTVPRAATTAAATDYNTYRLSSAMWGDASFMRLKNLSISYDISAYLRALKIATAKVYLSGQNILTITNYDGFDPETKGVRMPPVKTITAGLNIAF